MKLRWPALALVLVLIASLFLPAVSIHVHTRVDGAIAAQIPESVTLGKPARTTATTMWWPRR